MGKTSRYLAFGVVPFPGHFLQIQEGARQRSVLTLYIHVSQSSCHRLVKLRFRMGVLNFLCLRLRIPISAPVADSFAASDGFAKCFRVLLWNANGLWACQLPLRRWQELAYPIPDFGSGRRPTQDLQCTHRFGATGTRAHQIAQAF
jgi:hypothetical protein